MKAEGSEVLCQESESTTILKDQKGSEVLCQESESTTILKDQKKRTISLKLYKSTNPSSPQNKFKIGYSNEKGYKKTDKKLKKFYRTKNDSLYTQLIYDFFHIIYILLSPILIFLLNILGWIIIGLINQTKNIYQCMKKSKNYIYIKCYHTKLKYFSNSRINPLIRLPTNLSFSYLLKMEFKKNNKPNEIIQEQNSLHLTLVLDLDETLVHCTKTKPDLIEADEANVIFKNGKKEKYYILKRPYLAQFLDAISQFYDIIIFTSSQKEYADLIIDTIDEKKTIKKRYYRDFCTKDPNGYIKDLKVTKLDLKKTVMIDNSKIAFKFNEDNAFQIKPWLGLNNDDNELHKYMNILLNWIHNKGDIRKKIKEIKDEDFYNQNSDVNSFYDEEN